ncbi:hypothetical protein LTR12_016449 [Friedmanniomyces endolithicus]|nr:hypothetical protein LTR12_016449 [Friedmanniomyces endolithicus]
MGSVFGKAALNFQIRTYRITAGGEKALLAPPTRYTKAIRYDTYDNGSDVDTDDDLGFVTPHPDDGPDLLQSEAQPEQREADVLIPNLSELGSRSQWPSRKTGKRSASNAVPVISAPLEQQDKEALMEVIHAIASKLPGPGQETIKRVEPPRNTDEASQMIAALQLYCYGKKNENLYEIKRVLLN